MARLTWRPSRSTPISQVSTVQILTGDAATTYRLTVGGITVSTTGSAVVNTIASNLQAAWAASNHSYFLQVTATVATDTITLTGKAGVPFTATSSVTGGTGTIGAVTTTTNATSRHHWDDVRNWFNLSTKTYGAIPADGDDVFITRSDVNIAWGLNQGDIELNHIYIDANYNGTIGLNPSIFASETNGNAPPPIASIALNYAANTIWQITINDVAFRVQSQTDGPSTVKALVASIRRSQNENMLEDYGGLTDITDISALLPSGKSPDQIKRIRVDQSNSVLIVTSDSNSKPLEITTSIISGTGTWGSVGNPNRSIAAEYRQTRLKISAKRWFINRGYNAATGATGPKRLMLDADDFGNPSTMIVHNTGPAINTDSPAVDIIANQNDLQVSVERAENGIGFNYLDPAGSGEFQSINIGSRASGHNIWIGDNLTIDFLAAFAGNVHVYSDMTDRIGIGVFGDGANLWTYGEYNLEIAKMFAGGMFMPANEASSGDDIGQIDMIGNGRLDFTATPFVRNYGTVDWGRALKKGGRILPFDTVTGKLNKDALLASGVTITNLRPDEDNIFGKT